MALFSRGKKTLLAMAGAVLALGLFGPQSALAQYKIIRIDGSSTVFPATEAVAEEFQKLHRDIRVTVGISGTGGGFKKFVRGETDVQNASRPILAAEMEAAKKNGIEYIELPICFDALTVAVHPKNTWCDSMTVAELKKLWEPEAQGKIRKWSDIRPEWPDHQIELYGAGSDSGTFDYFTEAIVGKSKSSRGDYTASEDDNVLVRGIEGSKYALGYLPYSYYAAHEKRLKAVRIMWEGHTPEPVAPSMQNVLEGKYNPLARPLFIYVNKQSAVEKPYVREFVEFYLKNAAELVAEVNYLPLTSEAYATCLERFRAMRVGTAFAGHAEIGLPVNEILRREPTMDVRKPEEEEKQGKGG
ncbi:MAG: PstS family phosphate ABC transporter substrate-binding protein [Phycisphaerales bacterium]